MTALKLKLLARLLRWYYRYMLKDYRERLKLAAIGCLCAATTGDAENAEKFRTYAREMAEKVEEYREKASR